MTADWRERAGPSTRFPSERLPEPSLSLEDDAWFATEEERSPESLAPLEGQRDDSLSLYLREVRQYSLLSREEERRLAELKRLGQSEQSKPADLRSAEIIARGDMAARTLVEANLRLVVSIALTSHPQKLSLLDLIQEGNLGLVRAVQKYDERKGYRLSSYAIWWIRQAVAHAMAQNDRTIRLPLHVHAGLRQLARASARLVQENGREPTAQELAHALAMRVTKVEQLLALADAVSLDAPVAEEQGAASLGDLLPDPRTNTAEEATRKVMHACLKEQIRLLFQQLTSREQAVLALRFGLCGERARSLKEVSETLHLSRARVHQLERKALQRLRRCPPLLAIQEEPGEMRGIE
jgi:RNA polymerase primary sigma factor